MFSSAKAGCSPTVVSYLALHCYEGGYRMNDDDQIYTERDTARFLDVTVSCLRKWRAREFGPPYLQIGRMIRYRKSDVKRWLERCRSDSGIATKPIEAPVATQQ